MCFTRWALIVKIVLYVDYINQKYTYKVVKQLTLTFIMFIMEIQLYYLRCIMGFITNIEVLIKSMASKKEIADLEREFLQSKENAEKSFDSEKIA